MARYSKTYATCSEVLLSWVLEKPVGHVPIVVLAGVHKQKLNGRMLSRLRPQGRDLPWQRVG